MEYENLLKLLKTRRSIRRYKPDPVPDEYVNKIIEAARWAPSGANSQPWEFVVVRDPALKARIVQLVDEDYEIAHRIELSREPRLRHAVYGKPPHPPHGYATAQVFIVLCGDTRMKNALPLAARMMNGEGVFKSSLANTFIYMHLAITSLGLGAQWVSNTALPYVQSQLKALLGIPDVFDVYDTIALGFPDEEPRPRPVRPLTELTHNDKYDMSKYRTDKDIEKFILSIHQARK